MVNLTFKFSDQIVEKNTHSNKVV